MDRLKLVSQYDTTGVHASGGAVEFGCPRRVLTAARATTGSAVGEEAEYVSEVLKLACVAYMERMR